MTVIFWVSMGSIVYAYLGYAVLLHLVARRTPAAPAATINCPSLSFVLPVHNEAIALEQKLLNTFALDYPADRLQIIVVSDGSTDDTAAIARRYQHKASFLFIELSMRSGKAGALNHALQHATGEIVIFSDVSIMLERDALRHIIAPFDDASVGCVSGEDRIVDGGGEGLYGRYELHLRDLESHACSIVGASGSFYAQRRRLCKPFAEGMAPDFLSVLETVEQGYRAVSAPQARGTMTSVRQVRQEFQRKVRTLVRGMAALAAKRGLLNPSRYGLFALQLWSHKVMRWLVPVFLMTLFVSSVWLAKRPIYAVAMYVQIVFYVLAATALLFPIVQRFAAARVAAYFTVVNAAIVVAWFKFFIGVRVEIWNPSRRTL